MSQSKKKKSAKDKKKKKDDSIVIGWPAFRDAGPPPAASAAKEQPQAEKKKKRKKKPKKQPQENPDSTKANGNEQHRLGLEVQGDERDSLLEALSRIGPAPADDDASSSSSLSEDEHLNSDSEEDKDKDELEDLLASLDGIKASETVHAETDVVTVTEDDGLSTILGQVELSADGSDPSVSGQGQESSEDLEEALKLLDGLDAPLPPAPTRGRDNTSTATATSSGSQRRLNRMQSQLIVDEDDFDAILAELDSRADDQSADSNDANGGIQPIQPVQVTAVEVESIVVADVDEVIPAPPPRDDEPFDDLDDILRQIDRSASNQQQQQQEEPDLKLEIPRLVKVESGGPSPSSSTTSTSAFATPPATPSEFDSQPDNSGIGSFNPPRTNSFARQQQQQSPSPSPPPSSSLGSQSQQTSVQGKRVNSAETPPQPIAPRGIPTLTLDGVASSSSSTLPRFHEDEKPQQQEKKDRIRQEFMETEAKYVESLDIVVRLFLEPLKREELMSNEDILRIFSNIDTICNMHKTLLADLQQAEREGGAGESPSSTAFANCLQKFVPFMKMYTVYINSFEEANKKLKELTAASKKLSTFLKECQARPECKLLDLDSFLIMPIQRLPRYELLLRDLIRNTPDASERASIESLFEAVLELNKHVNQSKGQQAQRKKLLKVHQEVKHKVDIFNRPDRQLLKEGPLSICEVADPSLADRLTINAGENSSNSSPSISQSVSKKLAKKLFTPFEEKYYFLFDDLLLEVVTKKDKEGGGGGAGVASRSSATLPNNAPMSDDDKIKYSRHYWLSSVAVDNVDASAPSAVVLTADDKDETPQTFVLTWITTGKDSDDAAMSELSADPRHPSHNASERNLRNFDSKKLYARSFYVKAASPQEKNEWMTAIAARIDDLGTIVDTKNAGGRTSRAPSFLSTAPSSSLPASAGGLPSTPEERHAYKEMMKKKYEEDQKRQSIDLAKKQGEELRSRQTPSNNNYNRSPASYASAGAQKGKSPASAAIDDEIAKIEREIHSNPAFRNPATAGRSQASSTTSTSSSRPSVDDEILRDDKWWEKEFGEQAGVGGVVRPPPPSLRLGESPVNAFQRERERRERERSEEIRRQSQQQIPQIPPQSAADLEKLRDLERQKSEYELKMRQLEEEKRKIDREIERERSRSQIDLNLHLGGAPTRSSSGNLVPVIAGANVCGRCGQVIEEAVFVKVGDKTYHSNHFVCAVCGCRLAGQKFFPVGNGQQPHCTACYDRLHGVKCAGCGLSVEGQYLQAFDKNWHENCLRCTVCNCTFDRSVDNRRMMSKDERPCCKGCFGRTWNQGRVCAKCGLAAQVGPDSVLSKGMDKIWHKHCQ